jgi:hypothetical protein
MTIRDLDDYQATVAAIGVCISARVPFLLWGSPGVGKTSLIESAAASGIHVETLIVSHHEPSDFAGLPVVAPDGSVTFAPPAWATRLAAYDGPAVAFFDEWTTAAPAVQAAALRPLTHYEVGALRLPTTVSFGAAANPADVATAGWELSAPAANRFVHLDFELPLDVFSACFVTGAWPALSVSPPPVDHPARVGALKALVVGYLRARQGQLHALPADAAARGRAWPSPRTWDYLCRLVALAEGVGAPAGTVRLLVHGCVGAATGHEFLAYRRSLDLPDPDELLADPDVSVFHGLRVDRVHALLHSVLAAVAADVTPARWTNGVVLAAAAASAGHLDAAVPVVRALVREDLRPAAAALPAEIKVFAGTLALAGLLREPAA